MYIAVLVPSTTAQLPREARMTSGFDLSDDFQHDSYAECLLVGCDGSDLGAIPVVDSKARASRSAHNVARLRSRASTPTNVVSGVTDGG